MTDALFRGPAAGAAASPLLSMPEIAALAQVKRPVVSTWRRRYTDFPAPVAEMAGRVQFDGEEIAQWLLATGLGNADPAQLRAELVLYSLAAHADRSDALRTVDTIGALLSLRYLDEQPLAGENGEKVTAPQRLWDAIMHRAERIDPDDEFLLRELQAAGKDAVPLVHLAEDMIEAAYGERGAYEWLLASRSRLGATTLAVDALAPELLNLLVQLADLRPRLGRGERVTLADPYARAGDVLAALIREAEEPESITALAADPDERLVRIVRRRLLLAGIDEFALDVQTGTDLEERLADPQIVVTQLPYHPGEDRSVLSALADVERIADLLGPGCTAIVLGSADALVDAMTGTEGSKLRSALLRRNLVEAVISLPAGTLPYRPAYRPALWILTREPVSEAEGYVLIVDISAEALTERVSARLAEDVLLWRAEGFQGLGGHDPRYGRVARVAELDRAFGGPLTPPGPPASQILARTVMERPALIAEAETRLERVAEEARAYGEQHGPFRGRVQRRMGRLPERTTLGALIKQRRVTKLKGHRVDETDISGAGHHSVIGPEEITGFSPIGARRIDRLVLAAKYDRVALTEPGDLVYTVAPELGLYVDHEGFKVVTFPARVLRVRDDDERPLTPSVLAALLRAARATRRSPSAVRPRRIEDYQLPDLEPDDIERFDTLLAETERRGQLLQAQINALDEAKRLTIAGLADGTLTIDEAAPNRSML